MTLPVVPLKRLATIKARVGWKGLTSDEFESDSYAYLVTGRDFRGKYIDWESCYQVSADRYSDDPFIQLRNRDLLVTKDGTIGKVALVDGLDKPACLNSGVFLVRPRRELDTSYAYWVLQSSVFSDFIAEVSRGSTIQHLYQEEFREIRIPLPDLSRQHAIAVYLDRETAHIDALIAKNEELVALLAERRASAVDHAIERVYLRQGAQLRRWLRFITSGSRGWGQYYDDSGDEVFLRIGDLQRNRLELRPVQRQRVSVPSGAEGARARTEQGDLLVSITADLGSVAVVDQGDAGAYVSQHVALVRLDKSRLLPRFAAYAISSRLGKSYFERAAYGGTKVQLSLSDVRSAPMPAPAMEQQAQIVEALDSLTRDVDAATSAAKRAIQLARERRAALISAAVTGKIDVGVAA